MCAAIADCANVDEVAGIERQFAEIRLRACIRIGEISRDLEKSNQARGGRHPTDGKPTKTEQLIDAGISTSTANRYEELTGGREEQGQKAAKVAAEKYFAE